MTTSYTIVRRDGKLVAKTSVFIDEKRRLDIETSKWPKELRCYASVNVIDGLVMSHRYGYNGDYSRTVARAVGARGSEKAIRWMHEAALLQFDEIVAAAKAHYGITEAS